MPSGTMVQVVPERLIVQSLRAARWKPEAIDSTLTLTFWLDEADVRIELIHANRPTLTLPGSVKAGRSIAGHLGAITCRRHRAATEKCPVSGDRCEMKRVRAVPPELEIFEAL
jgi:hypothetical protein